MKKPYIKEINPNSLDSHQVSPEVMLTVLRFSNRDTYNYNGNNLETRKPLIIYNDAISVNTSNTKGGLTSNLSVLLLAGDINYSTAISSGDIVLLNMVNWGDKVSIVSPEGNEAGTNTLRSRAASLKPINSYNDGFKGVFRVQKVERVLRTDPNSGTKMFYYELTAFGFKEFNQVVYYDPQIYSQLEGNVRLFMQQFDGWFGNVVSKKENSKVQNIIPVLISSLIGQGVKKVNNKLPSPQTTHFRVPDSLGPLLGLKGVKYASEIYNYYIGIWTSSASGASNPSQGFNPNMKTNPNAAAGFYETGVDLQGRKVVEAEYWNNVKVWDIVNKYVNTLINECFTTYRVNPEGRVMPSLIVRQKPFTSNHFQSPTQAKSKPSETFNNTPNTKFLELPRWKLNPNLVNDIRIGKDDAARINFVQVYTRTVAANDSRNRARQTGTRNYTYDIGDIERNGLRPYLATADFDYPENGDKSTKGKEWANLVGDWVIGGHLKESGTISCQGIQDPISVGDNLEFMGVVYHIEQVTHVFNVNPSNGKKTFKTNLVVSYGVDPRSDKVRPVYTEMDHTDRLTKSIEDYERGERVLPGFSDTQQIVGRVNGEELKETAQKSFTPDPTRTEKTDENKIKGDNKEKDVADYLAVNDQNGLGKIDPSE